MENTRTVYFNMCHHYRKILGAKPRVDTSLPKSLRMKENNNKYKLRREDTFIRSKTSSQENLQQRVEMQNTITRPNTASVICPYYYQRHFKKEIENAKKSFTPTILKNESSQSMVRASRTPHQARKNRVQLPASRTNDLFRKEKAVRGNQNVKKIVTTDEKQLLKVPKQKSISSVNSYSEESSEDSAYNEGECNTDSRGSTPQNALNKHRESSKLRSIMHIKSIPQNPPQPTRTKVEEVVRIQFLTDITNDILRKNIYTNTALRNVLQQHVKLNKYDLQLETMLTEITKLQERLGIPKEEKFDDEDFGLGGLSLTNDDVNGETSETVLLESTTVPLKYENDLIGRDAVPPTSPKIEKNAVAADGTNSSDSAAIGVDENQEQNGADYSDNFSEENSYATESSRSEGVKSDIRSINSKSSNEINDEAASEVEEDVQEVDDDKSEKYSDIDESISHSGESDSEISEIC